MVNFRDTVSLTGRKSRKSKTCPEQLSRTQISYTTYRIVLYFLVKELFSLLSYCTLHGLGMQMPIKEILRNGLKDL